MNLIVENIIRFFACFVLQVLLLNNLQFWGLCSPAVYILFLIALPVSLPRWAEMLIGFATGLLMDLFCNTFGIHAAACILLSYLRPLLIKAFVADNERLLGTLTMASVGFVTYLRIVATLVVIHHTVLFALEAFSFHNWWITFAQIVISSAVTIGLILGVEAIRK